jgi:protein ImuB
MPRTFEEVLDLEYGVDRIEPLIFVLRRLVECVTGRIELYGLGCKELELGLELEGGGRDFRTIVAAAPTTDHKIFVTLVRAELEARPPTHAVTKLAVAGAATRIAPAQLDLLRPAGPAPAALAAMLARLAALCGPDRVGVLRCADSHRPDAVELRQFVGAVSSRLRADPRESTTNAGTVVRLALRAFRPPVPLEVFENRGTLDYVRGNGFGGRVVHWAGPWRLRGEWWTADPYAREYYDVELSDGGVYRLYRDARSSSWLADGMYD